MKITLEDLERLEKLSKRIKSTFNKDGVIKREIYSYSVNLTEDLLWMSTILYGLLKDITQRYDDSIKKTIKILDRINSRNLEKQN